MINLIYITIPCIAQVKISEQSKYEIQWTSGAGVYTVADPCWTASNTTLPFPCKLYVNHAYDQYASIGRNPLHQDHTWDSKMWVQMLPQSISSCKIAMSHTLLALVLMHLNAHLEAR